MSFTPTAKAVLKLGKLHKFLWGTFEIAGRAPRLCTQIVDLVLPEQGVHKLELYLKIARAKRKIFSDFILGGLYVPRPYLERDASGPEKGQFK